MPRPRVFLDISLDAQPIGRVIFELYNDIVPKSAENFRALCTGEQGVSQLTERPLYYKNSKFHRSISGFMIQGGDINGSGGESIYGPTFPDEDMSEPMSEAGLLCMANKGPDTNASQFFITLAPCEHLNGKHVVFGKVIRGYSEVVERMAEVPVDGKSRPNIPIIITNCGELELRKKVAQAPQEEASPPRRRRQDSSRSRSPAHVRSNDGKKKKRKSRRERSPSLPTQVVQQSSHGDRQETEEEYDARLEREEKERIAARRQRDLEDAKRRAHESSMGENGVRFKGRGRMRYVDPETRKDGRN